MNIRTIDTDSAVIDIYHEHNFSVTRVNINFKNGAKCCLDQDAVANLHIALAELQSAELSYDLELNRPPISRTVNGLKRTLQPGSASVLLSGSMEARTASASQTSVV